LLLSPSYRPARWATDGEFLLLLFHCDTDHPDEAQELASHVAARGFDAGFRGRETQVEITPMSR